MELLEVEPDHLRRQLLMVQQDVFLFDDDVAFNVSLGDPDLMEDPSRIEQALETVQAADFLRERGGLSAHRRC